MTYSFSQAITERKVLSVALRRAEEWEHIASAWQKATRHVFAKKTHTSAALYAFRLDDGILEVVCKHAAVCAAARFEEQKLLASLNRSLEGKKEIRSLRFRLAG